ncbi:ABC transporter substrate-binding protein [Thermanaerothrix sp.]|jgi:ABC-type nitrate/sulfonate/bicarbonate transport system substrate-binding protein|uniref:ABC transporter substrate-binding protein n=1 Tax=Thermanaerothrix sp. TaxID=2972675 RepID=UPI002ADD5098|nr:ABC transporter substrate-binding protein [Thermanaerothrix sp.]
MIRRSSLLLLVLFSILLIVACQPSAPPTTPTPPRTALTFMAGYKPQANLPFVGAYVAKEKGYFEAEGLDVTIEHSPGQGQHLQLLAAGKVQVTTQDAAVLLQRRADPGLPLVSIALIGQRGQQAFAALKESGMVTPKDWEGHLVGYKGTPPPDLFALLHAAGADVNKVNLVNVGFDPRLLVEGKVDVYPLFKSNEPFLLRSWGYEITLWDAADYGVPTLGLTYVTSESLLREQPDVLARFLRAALRGIDYAAQHPEEAVQIVLKYTGPETNPDHMRYMLETELKDAQSETTREHGWGWQTQAQWQALADMLHQYNVLPSTDITNAFTTRILEMAKSSQ